MGPRVPFAPALLTSSLLITLHIYFISSLLFILFIIRVMVNKAVEKKSMQETNCLTQYLEVELAVDSLPLGIHHFKGVTSISIHVLITIRNAAITEQKAHLMGGLRTQ